MNSCCFRYFVGLRFGSAPTYGTIIFLVMMVYFFSNRRSSFSYSSSLSAHCFSFFAFFYSYSKSISKPLEEMFFPWLKDNYWLSFLIFYGLFWIFTKGLIITRSSIFCSCCRSSLYKIVQFAESAAEIMSES